MTSVLDKHRMMYFNKKKNNALLIKQNKTMKRLNKKILSTAALSIFALASLNAASVATYDGTDASYEDALSSLEMSYTGAYTLVEAGTGDFTITKYVYNTSTNSFEEVYYDVDINDYVSETTGYTQYYYTWNGSGFTRTTTEPSSGSYFSAQGSRGRGGSLSASLNNQILVGISSTDNGGAIAISGTGNSITNTVFIGNTVTKTSSQNALGGALISTSGNSLVTLDADFIANYTSASNSTQTSTGGAIHNAGTITTLTGDFVANYATNLKNGSSNGGAINNSGTIGDTSDMSSGGITEGSFIGNYTTSSASSLGGAINNSGNNATITNIKTDFISNYASGSTSALGGAIYNTSLSELADGYSIYSISGDFTNNYATSTTLAQGGAIYNTSTINNVSSSFINNYATSTTSAQGGAIYNSGTINFTATSNNIYFYGNYTTDGTTKTSNAIYNSGTIDFNSSTGYSIIVNDGINGSSGTMTISGAGTTVFNNTVTDQSIKINDGATLALGSSASLTSNYLDLSEIATLSFIASTGDSTISITDNTYSFGYTSYSLDLSDVFGDFSITLNLDASICDDIYLHDISLVFTDTDISGIIDLSDDTYTISDSDYASLSEITITDTSITISGTVFGAAVPEPSTYAMIFGVVALGFAAYRRRK